jgi:hypothetical protein
MDRNLIQQVEKNEEEEKEDFAIALLFSDLILQLNIIKVNTSLILVI